MHDGTVTSALKGLTETTVLLGGGWASEAECIRTVGSCIGKQAGLHLEIVAGAWEQQMILTAGEVKQLPPDAALLTVAMMEGGRRWAEEEEEELRHQRPEAAATTRLSSPGAQPSCRAEQAAH